MVENSLYLFKYICIMGGMDMSNITGDDVKTYLKKGGKFAGEIALEILGESINQAGARAFSDAIEIGIKNTIMALLDTDVSDDEIIRVLNKHWGINQNEAEKRIVFEKGSLAIDELKRYLKLQGLSDDEIHQFMLSNGASTKIRHNSNLWKLWHTPDRLMKEIQGLE